MRSWDIRDQSLKLCKIAPIFGRVLLSQISGEAGSFKYVPTLSYLPWGRHVEKFLEVTSFGPKVITANTLNFKPISECLLLKIVGGPPFPMACALVSLGHYVARVKIWVGSAL